MVADPDVLPGRLGNHAIVSSIEPWPHVTCVVEMCHFIMLRVQKLESKPEPRQALANLPEYVRGLPGLITETSAMRVQNCANLSSPSGRKYSGGWG